MMWALLDCEGQPVRYFDYAHDGAVEIKEPKLTFDELLELNGECLL